MDVDRSGTHAGRLSLHSVGGISVIRLEGEVDDSLRRDIHAMGRAVERRGLPISLDATGLSFMDSAGLALVVRAVRAEGKSDRKPTVIGASGALLELLGITGLLAVLTIVETRTAD